MTYPWAHLTALAPVRARFDAKTRLEAAPMFLDPALGPCLMWTGAQTRGSGKRKGGGPYGSFNVGQVDGRSAIVRCTVFVCVAAGKMIPGHHPDHLCKRTLCVQETHLEVVTPTVNSRRRWDGRRKSDRRTG